MKEEDFRRTVIETLNYDNQYKNLRESLLPIVSRSSFNFIPQYGFAVRSGQHWENLEFRVPVPLINQANSKHDEFVELFRYVYQEDRDFDLNKIYIKPQIITGDDPPVENDVEFQRIQDTIIQGIRDAKHLIWIAVAWFSNDVLYNELLKRKKDGLSIRIVVSDENSNQALLPKLRYGFETYTISRYGYNNLNRMHDKFCIVDLDYVMHGSCNWTKVANYNGETLVTSIDRGLVKKFADEFIRLIKSTERCGND